MPRKGQKMSIEHCKKMSDIAKQRNYFGNKNPKWRGGRVTRTDGRVMVYCPDHPYVSHGGTYVLEYRLIVEKMIGRYLLPEEIVHHIDGNVLNNNPENLQVMTQSEHAKLDYKKTRKINKKTGRFMKGKL